MNQRLDQLAAAQADFKNRGMLDGESPCCMSILSPRIIPSDLPRHKDLTKQCLGPTEDALEVESTQASIPDEDEGSLPEPGVHAEVRLATKTST